MKTLNLHATQTKKTYRKPALKKMGDIAKLTQGQKAGSSDGSGEGSPIT